MKLPRGLNGAEKMRERRVAMKKKLTLTPGAPEIIVVERVEQAVEAIRG